MNRLQGKCFTNNKEITISVIFENDTMREKRTLRAINKYQKTVYVRSQTNEEKVDAQYYNRMFSEYSIFLKDKKIKGSLGLALKYNSDADKKHISADERIKIADALRSYYLENHPDYKEPVIQQTIEF